MMQGRNRHMSEESEYEVEFAVFRHVFMYIIYF